MSLSATLTTLGVILAYTPPVSSLLIAFLHSSPHPELALSNTKNMDYPKHSYRVSEIDRLHVGQDDAHKRARVPLPPLATGTTPLFWRCWRSRKLRESLFIYKLGEECVPSIFLSAGDETLALFWSPQCMPPSPSCQKIENHSRYDFFKEMLCP